VKRAAFAFGTLAAATIALAQQTSPQPGPPSTAPQEQTAPSPNASPRMSETDRQTLLTDCLRQVQAANPSVPEKDVKAYCEKQVNSYAPQ
jgi:hypothetical protein